MTNNAKQCLIYGFVFSFGYLFGCGGGGGTKSIFFGGGEAPPLRILSSSTHRPAIFPTNTGTQPVLASMFAQAAPSAASQLAQSFDSACDAYSSTFGQGMHAALGNSGLLSLNFLRGNLCETVISAVGADENGRPAGFPVILSGSVNTLVAYGTFVSGNRFRCLDQTHAGAVTDGVFVRAYYDLAHDGIIVGSGTNQLPVTCTISIPSGDDILNLTVQWLKS